MTIRIGEQPLSIEQVYGVSKGEPRVELAESARLRILRGRGHLENLIAAGERIYGVNTGVGGNIVFQLAPDQGELDGELRFDPECGTNAWFYDDPENPSHIVLCPEACSVVQAESAVTLAVDFACEPLFDIPK